MGQNESEPRTRGQNKGEEKSMSTNGPDQMQHHAQREPRKKAFSACILLTDGF